MKHTKLKLVKMLDELLNYIYYLGSKEVDVNIKELEDVFQISIECNYMEGLPERKIEKLIKGLNVPREEDMEEYYWELAGECDIDNDLSIIGMMSDEAYVDVLPGNKLKIRIIRKK